MSNNKRVVTEGKRYLVMNLTNGAVQIVVAKSYWKAFDKAVKWFGSNRIRVVEDHLSSQLS
jgi:hypothetical protein